MSSRFPTSNSGTPPNGVPQQPNTKQMRPPPSKVSSDTVAFVAKKATVGAVVYLFIFGVVCAVGASTEWAFGVNLGRFVFYAHELAMLYMAVVELAQGPDYFKGCMVANVIVPVVACLWYFSLAENPYSTIAVCMVMQWVAKLVFFVSFPREIFSLG